MKDNSLVPIAGLESCIHLLRGERVMLDADLAQLYGVATGHLNRAVKRNRKRFPADFLFQLTAREADGLIFQIGMPKARGGRRHFPYAFTQEGVAMLSSVLRSPRAVRVNVEIMRAFVRMRGFLASQVELTKRLAQLEKKSAVHGEAIREIFLVIKGLIPPARETRPKREIGFHTGMAAQPQPKPARQRRAKSIPASP